MSVNHDDSRKSRSMNASPTVVQTVWVEIRHGASYRSRLAGRFGRDRGQSLRCQRSSQTGAGPERWPGQTVGVGLDQREHFARMDGRPSATS